MDPLLPLLLRLVITFPCAKRMPRCSRALDIDHTSAVGITGTDATDPSVRANPPVIVGWARLKSSLRLPAANPPAATPPAASAAAAGGGALKSDVIPTGPAPDATDSVRSTVTMAIRATTPALATAGISVRSRLYTSATFVHHRWAPLAEGLA